MHVESNPFLVSTIEIPTVAPVIKARDYAPFCDSSTLATVVCVSLAVVTAMDFITLGNSVMSINETAIHWLSLLQSGLAVIWFVLFITWMLRTYQNLASLKSTKYLRTSAWWIVVMWFVPWLNLIEPYHVMQEIWRGSDPTNINKSKFVRRKGSALVACWWTATLGLGILQMAVVFFLGSDSDLATIRQFTTIIQPILGIVATALLMVIVHRISANQAQRHALVTESLADVAA